MKFNCAIVASALILLVSAIKCYSLEDYADVNCKYEWGGTVCDCDNSKYLMKLPMLHGNIRQIDVRNCENLYVPADSLSDLREVIGIKFENVSELDIREYSFNSTRSRPSIRMEFIGTNIQNLPSHFFKGNLEELMIKDSNISKIHLFALTGLFSDIISMKIINSTIGQIESQAFRKLTIRNLEIIDTTFQMNSVSRTFYDCHIENLIIEGSHFTMLNPSTFDVREVKRLRIFNTTFGVIDGEAFVMDVADRAIFNNNTINMMNHGAFKGITMNTRVPRIRTEDVFFEFNNNNVDFIHPEQEVFFCPDMKLQMNKLYLRDPRSCETVGRIYETKFFNDNSNVIFMRTEKIDDDFSSLSYLNDRCRTDSNWFLILMIVVAVIVLLLILIPAIFCYLRNKKKLDIVMPEPRTYRQTQIVMQVETHGLIKTDF